MTALAPPSDRRAIVPATLIVAQRYDRIAGVYDLADGIDRAVTDDWRRALWSAAVGPRILEVGIGAGINLPYHPAGAEVMGIDISPRMLDAAHRRAARLGVRLNLALGDVQALPMASGSFDTVVGTFVFCSVPDPLAGLEELRRVLRPGGQLLLLEHVQSCRSWLAPLLRRLDPLVVRLAGAHVARDTIASVRRAGFEKVIAHPLLLDVVQRIEARSPDVPS
jgi:ubiquinone/menaquinone biosynthesis C-methylase UbiE